MNVFAGILLLFFGYISFALLYSMHIRALNKLELATMLVSILITALSAGCIWGGMHFGF